MSCAMLPQSTIKPTSCNIIFRRFIPFGYNLLFQNVIYCFIFELNVRLEAS